ncbi:hypothetical protein MXF31_13280 [Mammaliicoccus sciuri]|nr:hypothetical protein [Mammaliicoccus sciuri]MEB5650609.1 hypothetical protein [Mammaliicoccus sciuri]
MLIDRLSYKEIELLERTKVEQNHIDQISHDINTPLTALRLELFHLSQQYGIEDENIEVSYERIDYISKLIKNISIDQKENIQYFYTFNREVDVVSICKKIIDKWQYLIQRQNMNIKLEGVQNQLIWSGEELWFERLFENIISNIYEHSNAKNIKVTINQNQVSFVDDGIGFKVDNYQDSNGLNIIKYTAFTPANIANTIDKVKLSIGIVKIIANRRITFKTVAIVKSLFELFFFFIIVPPYFYLYLLF